MRDMPKAYYDMRKRLHVAVNTARPWNGFITGAWIANGWTGQPAYEVRA